MFITVLLIVLGIFIGLTIASYINSRPKELTPAEVTIQLKDQEIGKLSQEKEEFVEKLQTAAVELNNLNDQLKEQIEANEKIISYQRSSEVRLGMVAENLIPMLQGLPYDSQNLRHMGTPIDYCYFDWENAELVFIEVKTAKSKESKRQKLIRNMITSGKVFYEELRVGENGITIKRAENKE